MNIPPFDPTRKVFAVPVDFTVKTRVYVLATNHAEAIAKANATDMDALLSINADMLWVNEETRCEMDDFDVQYVYTEQTTLCDEPDRDIREHPDWIPLPTK